MTTAAAGVGALASAPLRLYISGYTPSSGGHGPGITVFDRPAANAPWKAVQVVEADDPSFLMVAEGAVHATSETIEGRVVVVDGGGR